MKLTHYELAHNPREAWYGYQRFGCPDAVKLALKRESQIAESKGCISEREFEVDLFLSILADIKKPHINLIEAGAGWGEWCMALAGVITKKIIPVSAGTYFAIGVEGDKRFYEEMQRNFKCNHLSARAIHGAVSNNGGFCRFNTGFISKTHCGGSMSFKGTFKGRAIGSTLLGLSNVIFGKSSLIQEYPVDWLATRYNMPCVDILHIDTQGSELLVLEGANNRLGRGLIDYILIGTHAPNLHSEVKAMLANSHGTQGSELLVLEGANNRLGRGLIDYILIGTHAPNLHSEVKAMLANSHGVIAEAIPNTVNHIDGVPPVWIAKGQDGLILFKRRENDFEII